MARRPGFESGKGWFVIELVDGQWVRAGGDFEQYERALYQAQMLWERNRIAEVVEFNEDDKEYPPPPPVLGLT